MMIYADDDGVDDDDDDDQRVIWSHLTNKRLKMQKRGSALS